MPRSYQRPLWATAAVSVALSVAFLALPLGGTDLSAQVARGEFVRQHGLRPVDFRWYGGIFPDGYSMVTGPLDAVLGARLVGVVGSVVGAVAFAFLLVRTGVRRPLFGGVVGAVCLVFNLVSGRTTFALGMAVGLLALCAVTLDELSDRTRTVLTGLLAALSSATSPVAGVFTGLAGLALLLTGRRRDGLTLVAGAAVPLTIIALLFRDGGIIPFDPGTAKLFVALAVAVVFLVPPRYPSLRVGAGLAALSVFVGYALASPLGGNTARLPLLFTLPVVAATAELPGPGLLVALLLLSWWQPPLMLDDVSSMGDRAAQRSFFQPLVAELDRRKPIGRVEVVPLHDHWESAYVADAVPLARGWERQVDVGRNALFYGDALGPSAYQGWLYDNGVTFVALPLSVRLDHWGRQEAALIQATLPYLAVVWSNADWQLYRVKGAQPLVTSPGRLVSSDATGATFDAPQRSTVLVRLRWSRWLTLSGPPGSCLTPAGTWTLLRIDRPGRYRLSSGWQSRQGDRCPPPSR